MTGGQWSKGELTGYGGDASMYLWCIFLLAFSYIVISEKKMLGLLIFLQLEQKLNLLFVISNVVYIK